MFDPVGADEQTEQAYRLLQSARAKQAFELARERHLRKLVFEGRAQRAVTDDDDAQVRDQRRGAERDLDALARDEARYDDGEPFAIVDFEQLASAATIRCAGDGDGARGDVDLPAE